MGTFSCEELGAEPWLSELSELSEGVGALSEAVGAVGVGVLSEGVGGCRSCRSCDHVFMLSELSEAVGGCRTVGLSELSELLVAV